MAQGPSRDGGSKGLEEAAAGNLICTSSKVTLRSVSSSSSTICVPSAVVDGQQLICLVSGFKALHPRVNQIPRFRKGQCRGIDSWKLPICSHRHFKWSHFYCSEPSN